ncbi:hypothetical protein [Paraglaciecola sp. 25GB23A]|uniref:hypothetical protein n=1 Tax=Paraglaciecola sp. 25GB23A TaxID=3156068 RepID=UPI0032AE84EC
MRPTSRRNKSARTGNITQSFIDQQIVILHKAMAEKLYAQPDLVEQVKVTLQQRFENGNLRYGAFLTWQCILEQISNRDAFISAVLEDSDLMRKYRRRTPFVGILSEQERQQALDINATNPVEIAPHK